MTIYRLKFLPSAHKEWIRLDKTIRTQLQKKLSRIILNPHIPSARLSGWQGVYRIKLRKAGIRLIYKVAEEAITIFVVAVGRRENDEIYEIAGRRLSSADD